MKKFLSLLAATLLLTLTIGCRPTVSVEPNLPTEELTPPLMEDTLRIKTLTVEISRNGLNTETLMEGVKKLPDLLAAGFAGTDVEIEEIEVTVGASPADTAQALADGNIHMAFLPADGFLLYGKTAIPLFSDAHTNHSTGLSRGSRALICAAPTDYGYQLANRASSGKPLSWEEIKNARWGVLREDISYRCFDLWLADEYEGSRIMDLPDVTVYDSYETLFNAAAAEKMDALAFWDDARENMEEVWVQGEVQAETDAGFGRLTDIWKEIPVLDATERVYSHLVAVAPNMPELTDKRFAEGLAQALEYLELEAPDQMPVLGAACFDVVADEALDATRRLLTLEERFS